MRPRPSKRSEPGELQRLVLSVRHAINDLFAGYAIPEEKASTILRESVELLVRHCGQTDRPRQFFLQMLEDRCIAYVEAQEAAEEERDDGDDAPDA